MQSQSNAIQQPNPFYQKEETAKMSIMLDTSKLPDKSTKYKATWSHDGRSFGTYYAAARKRPRFSLEKSHPDVVRMLTDSRSRALLQLDLPPGWDIDTSWHSTEWDEGAYVKFCFVVPHFLKMFGRRGLPEETAHLFSAHLQLGERCSHRNFRSIELGSSLKFLPFLITAEDYRFFVFHPTPEAVSHGLQVFKGVMEEVRKFEHMLPTLLRTTHALVRLDEMVECAPSVMHMTSDIEREVTQPFNQPRKYARRLSFVYKDLPGSQDALSFFYEMNAKETPDE